MAVKRLLSTVLLLSPTPFAHAATEPDSIVMAAPDPAPVIEPAAAQLLDKSSAACAALSGLSLRFETTRQTTGKAVPIKGTLSVLCPGKAALRMSTNYGDTLFVTDGTQIWTQLATDPVSYKQEDVDQKTGIAAIWSRVDSLLGARLSSLLTGRSFLDLDYNFASVTSVPGGVQLTTRPRPGAAAQTFVFTIAFDPATHLISRVDTASTFQGQAITTSTVFTHVETNPQFTPSAFTYTPAADVKPYVEPPPFDPRLVVGAKPFPLLTKDLSGKKVSWDQFKGKVVLLDFWATWCGPCVGELPNVMKNYDKYHAQGFEVVGISLDEQKEALTAFIKARGIKYLNLYDDQNGRSNLDAKAYGVRYIPFTLLIGKDGRIAAVNEGGEKLGPDIEAALAQK